MKNQHPVIQLLLPSLALVAILVPGSVHAVDSSPGSGEIAIYTANAAGEAITTADFTHGFDTTAREDTDSFARSGSAITLNRAGHYLAIYNSQFGSTSGSNRSEIQSHLSLGGNALPVGWSQGYIRRTSGADDCLTSGLAVFQAGASEELTLHSFRTDNNGAGVQRVANNTGLQLVKLDDINMSYALLSLTTNVAGPGTATFETVPYDTSSLGDGFAYDAPGELTLTDGGKYLVTANTYINGPVGRTTLTQRLTLSGTEVTGSRTVVYLRGSSQQSCGDGAAAIGMIIEAAANDILRVQGAMGDGDESSTFISGRCGLAVVKLPDSAGTPALPPEFIRLTHGADQNVNAAADTALVFNQAPDAPEIDSAFSHTAGTSAVTVNSAGDYLFFGSVYDPQDEQTRAVYHQGWSVNGAAREVIGQTGRYTRNADDGAGIGIEYGNASGFVASGLAGADTVEMVSKALNTMVTDANLANPIALQGVNLDSLFTFNPFGVDASKLSVDLTEGGASDSYELNLRAAPNSGNVTVTVTADPQTEVSTDGTSYSGAGGSVMLVFSDTTPQTVFVRAFDDATLEGSHGGTLTHAVTATDDPASYPLDLEIAEITATITDDDVLPVEAVNDASSTNADEDTVATEALLAPQADLLGNDLNGFENMVISFDATSLKGASVSVDPLGTFTWDPAGSASLQALAAGEQTTDSFSYTVLDASGNTDTALVEITVDGVNDLPVVAGESLGTVNGELVTANLLANDSDADASDTILVTTFDSVAVPSGGVSGQPEVLSLSSSLGATVTVDRFGNFEYDPSTSATILGLAPGTTVTDSLTYEVSDGIVPVGGTVEVLCRAVNAPTRDFGMTGAGATVAIDVLGNDQLGLGTATPGATLEFLADTGGNSDTQWFNTGTASVPSIPDPANAPSDATLTLSVTNPPTGFGAAYNFAGVEGISHQDVQTGSYGPIDQIDATIEVVFRPSDQTGDEVLWEVGGTTDGSSFCLVGNQVIWTSVDNGNQIMQVAATLPAGAVAGGEFVHVAVTVDLTNDVVELFLNGVSAGTGSAVNMNDGSAGDLADWCGTDDGGIGRHQTDVGGDIAALGTFGTIDLGALTDYAGEVSILRAYGSILTPAEIADNHDSALGAVAGATIGDIAELAGTASPAVGTPIALPSGAQVTLEASGEITYDPNGAFDDLAAGFTAPDTFTYTLAGGTVVPVTVEVTGANADPQVTIAADQAVIDEGSAGSFTISASASVAGPVTVNLAYSGAASNPADYTGGSASVVIPDTGTDVPLNLTAIVDGLVESVENVVVTIESVEGNAVLGGTLSAETLINDENFSPGGFSLVQVFSVTSPMAGDMVPLDPIRVTDVNVGTTSITSASNLFVDHPAVHPGTNLDDGGNPGPPNQIVSPNQSLGVTMEVKFTPEAADLVPGTPGAENRRLVFEIGGSSNGCGIYLIDGLAYFACKMNSSGGQTTTSLRDLSWSGDGMVVVPLSGAPLPPGVPTTIGLSFSLDALKYSVNGADPVTEILLDRGGRTNWEGDNSVTIGENGPVGGPGGLSTSGLFDAAQYADLSGVTPVEYARMWNVAGGAVSFGTFARNEIITATLTIENYVDDATSGSLSASSGNGESYSAGVWTITGGLGAVNAALAQVTYTFGTAPPPVSVSFTADDQDAASPVSGAVALLTPITGGTVYVDDDFGGTPGSAIADADGGPPEVPATFLVDAFPTLGNALAVIDDTSTIVVNDGDYSSEVVSLTGTQTLRCTDSAGPVVIGSLNALATNSVDLQGNTLTVGNNSGQDGIDCAITGSGGLTKVGTDMLVVRGANTYTGTTTILDGVLRVGFFNADGLQGSLDGDGPVVVTAPGQLDLNVDGGLTISQTGAISGTGTVSTLGDGTIIFDGPAANTFSGGLDLGDGATSNFDGASGNQNGFVVINRSDHLGTGKIISRGAQLQAGSPGIVIPNDIDIDGGGFRNGGSIDFSFSGNISPINNNNRGFGNYGLEGLDLTITGSINTDGGAALFEGSNNKDNGTWTVTGDISGSGNVLTQNSFDGGIVTLAGNNTYTGVTTLETGTTLFIGTHAGGGAYTVQSGATLAGDGATDAPVTVSTGATLSPGTSIGTLATGGLTLSGTLVVEVDNTAGAPGSAWDQVVANGAVDVTGGSLEVIDLKAAVEAVPAEIAIIANDGADVVAGSFATESHPVDYLGSGGPSEVGYAGGDGNDVVLNPSASLSPIGTWRQANFGVSANAGDAANMADTGDFDLLVNLLEFAFGTDPNVADNVPLTVIDANTFTPGAPVPDVTFSPLNVTYRFTRRVDFQAAGLTYTPQFTADGETFIDSSDTPTVVVPDDGSGYEVVEVPFTVFLPDGTKASDALARVQVTLD